MHPAIARWGVLHGDQRQDLDVMLLEHLAKGSLEWG
jgi:hypothetical protein